jgi:hypothetical protein
MNQHYVPKVYLKNFSKTKGKDYFVNVYDKVNDRYFETNIKNICSETNLYTLNKNSKVAKHVLAVEKIYSDLIEPMYAKAYSILTNDNIFHISNLQRIEIIIGLFQFYYRNPIIFRKSLNIHLDNIQVLYESAFFENRKGLTYLDEDFSFSEWTLDGIQAFFIDKLLNMFKEQHIGATSELGTFHEFTIIEVEKILDDSTNFLTNDNPLFYDDLLSKTDNPFLKSNEFMIPLDKKHLVKIYHDNTKKINFIYRCKTLNVNVNLVNEDIYNRASRFIIGEKETFNDLKKLKEYFDSTSLEPKINFIKQILNDKKLMDQNKEGFEILKYYYNRYLENKTLSDQEENELMLEIQELNKATKRKKIT